MRRVDAVFWFLVTEAALSFALAGTFTITGVYFVKEAGLDPLELILVGTVMEVTSFVFEIPTGVVADTYSRRASVVVAWLLQGVAFVVVGLSPAFAAILVGYAIWGLAHTFESGAYEAWITDEVGADAVGPVFLRGTRISYLGALGGIAVSVATAAWLGLGMAIVCGGVVLAAIGLASAAVMPERGFRRAPREERRGWREIGRTAADGTRLVKLQPVLALILAIAFFAGMSTESADRLWEAQFIREIGLPTLGSLQPVWWFGIFRGGELLLGLAGTTFLLRRFQGLGGARLVRTLLVLTALQLVTAVAFGLAVGLPLALVSFWGYNLARSLTYPTYMTWLNQNIDDSSVRATVISFSGQADALGQTGGGPAVGAIGRAFGIRAALVVGAAVLAPALALYGRALRRGEQREAAAAPVA